MSTFPLRIPDDLKKEAAKQAEAKRYFAARGAHALCGYAKEILSRSGVGNPPHDDDSASFTLIAAYTLNVSEQIILTLSLFTASDTFQAWGR